MNFTDWVKLTYGDKDPRYYDKPRMFMPQTDWISDARGEVIVDFVGKFESLQDDFNEICKQIGRPRKMLPHVKKSDRGHYRDYYSEESEKVVADWFSRDTELFGYRF